MRIILLRISAQLILASLTFGLIAKWMEFWVNRTFVQLMAFGLVGEIVIILIGVLVSLWIWGACDAAD